MKGVVLSTTEAEYMALSEVVKELKFIVQLLQTMNITVELAITVHLDNVGAIWLSNNRNTGDRTKHIDISVGSHQVRFLLSTVRNTTKILQHRFLTLNFLLILL